MATNDPESPLTPDPTRRINATSGPNNTGALSSDNGSGEAVGGAALSVNLPPPPEYFSEFAPLPAYHVASELPTYEEAERTKGKYPNPDDCEDVMDIPSHREIPGLTLFSMHRSDIPLSDNSSGELLYDDSLLGNDFVFFTAFVTAFLFNWVGFLLLMCFCHTIAARYGALSGFGLSLTKWTLIVKRSTDISSDDNSWLWWLIMAFGLLICVRALVQYLHIKRSWSALTTSARERLFFFY